MAGFHFRRCPRRERVKFFQSSPSYLNNNAVTLHSRRGARRWTSEDPQPSSRSFLTFANGHYGIYFTIFNHELRREERRPGRYDANSIIIILPNLSQVSFRPEFHISKAKQETQHYVTELQSVSRELLSTWSLIKPKNVFKLLCVTRNFSSSTRVQRDELPDSNLKNDASVPKIEEIHEIAEDIEEPFESTFSKNQTEQIITIFKNHTSPDDLNIIYPLYQSMKRNNLTLPSIDEYNIVLRSVAMRTLDSDITLEAIESRLTCLLTVYQDVLAACSITASCKPNSETWNIILSNIFGSAATTVDLGSSANFAKDAFQAALVKSQEFCQVGVNLFLSLQKQEDLELDLFLPAMIKCIKLFPQLLTKELASTLKSMRFPCTDGGYFEGVISISKYFKEADILAMTKKEHYDFVSSVLQDFKEQASRSPDLMRAEYIVYESLVESLICSGNLPVATMFLDQILNDFKNQLQLQSYKLSPIKSQDISSLISRYILSILSSGKTEDLNKAYNLLQKFRSVPYIPELSVEVYNELIIRFINQYSLQEVEKEQSANKDELSSNQALLYEKLWNLYNYAVIRKDFQYALVELNKISWYGRRINCRDFLLSLSLDVGDHSNVARLLKEILLKNHLINDWNITKKACQYLYNGAVSYDNTYYVDLLWSFFEQQASHYDNNSRDLNSFLSENVAFLLMNKENTLEKILNSMIVFKAFSNFSLSTDNIYGLMCISMFMISRCESERISEALLFKIMHFESCLLNQFEDTDNHYLQLSENLIQFKQTLAYSFREAIAGCPAQFLLSEDMQQACNSLGIETQLSAKAEILNNNYYLDLTSLLTTNYNAGVSQFLECFKLGYNFNQSTWRALITRDFLVDYLEKENLIKVGDFVGRIASTDPDAFDGETLISSLISLKNDKINIQTLKYLAKTNSNILELDVVLDSFAESLKTSSNKYLLTSLCETAVKHVSSERSKGWLTKLISRLNALGESEAAFSLISEKYESFVYTLDVKSPEDESFLYAILMTLMNLKRTDEVNLIFAHYFSGTEGNKSLLQSEKLAACLINFYISVGRHEMVLENFSSLLGRSQELQQLIQFAGFLSQMSGKEQVVQVGPVNDCQSLGLALLNETSLFQMREIYEQNKNVVSDRESFFEFLITCLGKAAALTSGTCDKTITARLESIIKFCKVMQLKQLSAIAFVKVIRLLSATRAKEMLNILINKFMNNNELALRFNFFFLQIRVSSDREATILFDEFKSALEKVGDTANLEMMRAYERVSV